MTKFISKKTGIPVQCAHCHSQNLEMRKKFGKYVQLICPLCHCDTLVDEDKIKKL